MPSPRPLRLCGEYLGYDYQGARVQKNDGANNITTYVSRLYDINTANGPTKHIFAGGRRIASITGTNISYYHPDHLGSLSIATNGGGNPIQSVTYYPYGEVNTNSYSGTDLPYKFTGHELDPETGLYYCGARYYDASQGRFLTPDTIVQSPGDPQTLNRYAYARNNPLSFIDPNGHGFFSFLEDFFAALFGAAITVLTWGAGAPVACMLGGMVAGATGAAMHGGNLMAVVQGAFMGGLGGLVAGAAFLGGVPWQVMTGAGAAFAVGTGGVKGLESFAAGFAGGLAGGALGNYLNPPVNSSIAQAADYNDCLTDEQKQAVHDAANDWANKNVPYFYGGKTQSGADCTGAIWAIYQQAGIDYPYTDTRGFASSDYFEVVPAGQPLQTGDIGVYLDPNRNLYHAIMYDENAGPGYDAFGAHSTGGPPFGPLNIAAKTATFGVSPTWYRLYGTE